MGMTLTGSGGGHFLVCCTDFKFTAFCTAFAVQWVPSYAKIWISNVMDTG